VLLASTAIFRPEILTYHSRSTDSDSHFAWKYAVDLRAKASTSESLSVCMTYNKLVDPSDEISCTYENSDAPVHEGPYEDAPGVWKNFMKGPDINSTDKPDYPLIYEERIQNQSSCVFNGTAYPEGSTVNIGEDLLTEWPDTNQSFQDSGFSSDNSVCLDRNADIGGEWYNVDDWAATSYVREEIADNGGTKSGALDSDEWISLWIDEHPNMDADPEAIDPVILEEEIGGMNISGGFNLEQDCIGDYNSSKDGCAHGNVVNDASYVGESSVFS